MAKLLVHSGTSITETAYAVLVNAELGATSEVRFYTSAQAGAAGASIAAGTASIAILTMNAWTASGKTVTANTITSDTNASAGTAAYGAIFDAPGGAASEVFRFNVGTTDESIVLSSVAFSAGDTVSLTSLNHAANLNVALT